jgi:hypothetical protein
MFYSEEGESKMDWVSIVCAAIGGGLGGLIAGLLGLVTPSESIKRGLVVVLAVGGGTLGSKFLTPAARLELQLQDPKSTMSVLLGGSGMSALELRLALYRAYLSGGEEGLARKAVELASRKNAGLERLPYASDALVEKFFKAYLALLKKARQNNATACADWASGAAPVLLKDFGATLEEQSEFDAIASELLSVAIPPKGEGEKPVINPIVLMRLQTSFSQRGKAEGFDPEVTGRNVSAMNPDEKKMYCDAIVAFFEEIGALSQAERVALLRAIFYSATQS